MKRLFGDNSWIISVVGSLIFASLSLPSVIIFNHGSTTGGLEGLLFFIGMAFISLVCIYGVYWFANKWLTRLSLERKLLVVLFLSSALFSVLYLFYWLIIVRLWIYGLSTRSEVIGFGKQIFGGIMSMHLPVCLISITALYNQQLRKTKVQLIMAEKMLAESNLQKLIQQVDPHFLFNNLNILSALIRTNPEQATVFANKLSEIYRQLLGTQLESVIPLDQEIEFARNYFYLLSCRFQNSLNLVIENCSDHSLHELFIIPLSLQFMIENVVKHNIILPSKSITIEIRILTDHILVSNPVHKKEILTKMGLGLKNLKERYFLLTQKMMEYTEHGGMFRVKIPLIKKLKAHENIDC